MNDHDGYTILLWPFSASATVCRTQAHTDTDICVKPNPSQLQPNPGIQNIKLFKVKLAMLETITCTIHILCIVHHEKPSLMYYELLI